MFVGLLKRLKSRLESEWHPRVPWPRYSRKLTFQHSRPRPFPAARILQSNQIAAFENRHLNAAI